MAYRVEWKARLARLLTTSPQSTTDLAKVSAIPAASCRALPRELCADGVARETPLPRTRPSGFPPAGWSLREAA